MPDGDPIYLDNNASTPILPRVRDAIIHALTEGFGNPSAGHSYGRRARAIVEEARARVASLLGCDTDEVFFTGGGTESNNLALLGHAAAPTDRLLVTSAIDHPATLEPAAALRRKGAIVLELPVNARGFVDPEEVDHAIAGAMCGAAALVSIMLAQNETGVIQPIAAIAEKARERGATVHTDAAQAVGKIPVSVRALGVDLLSVAGHKLYAPKGVGALYIRRGITLLPVLLGAGHEHGLRPGTENVPGIAGLGEACAVALEDLAAEEARQRALRERLEQRLKERGFIVHGEGAERLPNTVNGRFPGVRGEALLALAPDIAFTTGSACHAGETRASRVLTAMGIAEEDAHGAIRLSLGRLTTVADVDRASSLLIAAARS